MENKQKIISQYMSEIGRKGGNVNKQKGSEYFKWVRSHKKTKKDKEEV